MIRRFLTVLLASSSLALAGCSAEEEGAAVDGADTGTDVATGTDTAGGDDAAQADATPEPTCVFPTNDGRIGYDKVIPDLLWTSAFRGDGSEFVFDLYDVYCKAAGFEQYETIIFLVSAGWCPQCPRLIQWLDLLQDRLEQEGALIVYLEAELNDGSPANSDDAAAHFSQYATNGSGIRIGDNSGEPANLIYESALVSAFPTSFVVRTRDMRIIASGDRSDYILPFVEIAMDPEGDWANPPPPEIVPEFPSNCDESAEEASEPNDSVAEAAALTPGSLDAGICNGSPDFYSTAIEGAWTVRIDIASEGTSADIDVFVVDEAGEVLMNGEEPVGSYGTTQREEFSYSGPATIVVTGYNGATSEYTLTLTEN